MSGKVSSPSRQASHKRGPARSAENKKRKIAKHLRQVAKKADKKWHRNPHSVRGAAVMKAKVEGLLAQPHKV